MQKRLHSNSKQMCLRRSGEPSLQINFAISKLNKFINVRSGLENLNAISCRQCLENTSQMMMRVHWKNEQLYNSVLQAAKDADRTATIEIFMLRDFEHVSLSAVKFIISVQHLVCTYAQIIYFRHELHKTASSLHDEVIWVTLTIDAPYIHASKLTALINAEIKEWMTFE